MTQPQRKKVLFLITKSNWGGAQRYVYDLATNTPPDWEPVVAFGGTGISGSEAGYLAEMLKASHVRTIHLPSLARNVGIADLKGFLEIFSVLRKERPDVLHLNSSKAGGLGALAGRMARIPRIIYTAHGWPFWEDRGALWLFAVRLFSWLTVLLSHRAICISEYDRDSILGMPFTRNKIHVIRNGLRSAESLDRSTARAALFDTEILAAHAADIWVVTVAELHPNKNLECALEAVKKYNLGHDRKIFYAIIGGGELEETLTKKADRHSVLLGFIPDAARYLRAFDIFLLPSLKEGVPYVVLEAGAAGLPVVASNVGGIPEMLKGASNGHLVHPMDADDVVRGLEDAMREEEDPPAGAPLSSIIEKRFSLQQMLEQTFDLYQRA